MAKTHFLILTVFSSIFIILSVSLLVFADPGDDCWGDQDCEYADESDSGDDPTTAGRCTEHYDWCTIPVGGEPGQCKEGDSYLEFDTCTGNTLREYYVQYETCDWTEYTCSNFESGPTGDAGDTPGTSGTCTSGVGASCLTSYSRGYYTTYDYRSDSYQEGCDNPGACPGGTGCRYIEYVRGDSSDTCGGNDICVAKYYDCDQVSNTCTACGLDWNLGTGDSSDPTKCCGDDSAEWPSDCMRSGAIAWSCSIDSCCTGRYACVEPGGVCRSKGNVRNVQGSGNDQWAACDPTDANDKTWDDCDDYVSVCSGVCSSARRAGESSVGEYVGSESECCGDDANEVRRGCNIVSGSNPETFGCSGTIQLCCRRSDRCTDDGSCFGAGSCRNDAWCDAGNWEDVDDDSTGCSTCMGTGRWGLSGDYLYPNCCGDDTGENYAYRAAYKTAGQYHIAWNDDTSDNACCNTNEKCVFQGTCYDIGAQTSGFNSGGDDNYARCRSGGIEWLDIDYGSAGCTASSLNWVTAGEAGVGEYGSSTDGGDGTTECCGDDAAENYVYERQYPSGNPNGVAWIASNTRCCNSAYDVLNRDEVCVPGQGSSFNAILVGSGYNGIDMYATPITWGYSDGNPSSWLDCDRADGTTFCPNICSSFTPSGESVGFGEYTSIGQMACCGDDYGEYYNYFNLHAYENGNKYGPDNTNDNACCDNDADCVYNGACYSDGYYDLDNDGRIDMLCYPDNGYGYDWWINVDYHSSYCTGRGFHWNVAGGDARAEDSYYTTATGTNRCNITASGHPSIQCCCGDDLGEEYRTRQCDGYACNTDPSDAACCNNVNDCVWSNACYSNGAGRPGNLGATCNNGFWNDTTAPTTTIVQDGEIHDGTTLPYANETSFNLTCVDSGGSGCDERRYEIIQAGTGCTSNFNDLDNIYAGGQVPITCPFGLTCTYNVCFASKDKAGNEENVQTSGLFHLETHACQGKSCGERCEQADGICNGVSPQGCFDACFDRGLGGDAQCLANDGCFLDCSLPSGSVERYCYDHGTSIACSGFQAACGRSGAYKCSQTSICQNSLNADACGTNYGGGCAQMTADWTNYDYPSSPPDFFTEGDRFYVNITEITATSDFDVLMECKVVRPNNVGNITFNNWGVGDVNFYYDIQAGSGDPEGYWFIHHCRIWTDFWGNMGWILKNDETTHQFVVDKSPPDIQINDPDQNDIYADNFPVNATVTDTWSPIGPVYYRWENSTNGPWEPMLCIAGGECIAIFDVSKVADGYYDITVNASDIVGNEALETVENIQIDRQAPDITLFLPTPRWYNSDFEVKARATDNQGVTSVEYRWENSSDPSDVGTWTQMGENPIGSDNYTRMFTVSSVDSGNYTINVTANDGMGNTDYETVENIGIDYVKPTSSMNEPWPPGEIIMTTLFNTGWTGSDAHSGIDCYYVEYTYQDSGGVWAPRSWNVSFGCTSSTTDVFDAEAETGIDPKDMNNYTFHFRSIALDNAGNKEVKSGWETNVTIYVPRLVYFDAIENTTRAIIKHRGKVANNRTVIINVRAKEDFTDYLDIMIYYSNHTLGQQPSEWQNTTCLNVRECNASIRILVGQAEEIMEVNYYIVAINSSDPNVRETLPPGAPNTYLYYFVYFHPLCNFAVKGFPKTLYITFGSSELIPVEVRNIQHKNDKVGMELTGPAIFLENKSSKFEVPMSRNEEKIVIANLIPPSEEFPVVIICNSTTDPTLWDQDNISIVISLPADFSGLSESGILLLLFLTFLIYLKFVSTKN